MGIGDDLTSLSHEGDGGWVKVALAQSEETK